MGDRPRRGRLDLFPSTNGDSMFGSFYAMINNDIIPFFAMFQIKNQINKYIYI